LGKNSKKYFENVKLYILKIVLGAINNRVVKKNKAAFYLNFKNEIQNN